LNSLLAAIFPNRLLYFYIFSAEVEYRATVSRLPISLFGLNIYLEKPLKWHLYVIIRLILAQILSFMKY